MTAPGLSAISRSRTTSQSISGSVTVAKSLAARTHGGPSAANFLRISRIRSRCARGASQSGNVPCDHIRVYANSGEREHSPKARMFCFGSKAAVAPERDDFCSTAGSISGSPYEQHCKADNECGQTDCHGHERLRFLFVEFAFHRQPASFVAGTGLSYKVNIRSLPELARCGPTSHRVDRSRRRPFRPSFFRSVAQFRPRFACRL